MKTIIFACTILLLSSCGKEWGDSGGIFGNYDWGNGIDVSFDSTNTVKADVVLNGTTTHLSAAAYSTSIYRFVFSQFTDSSQTDISGGVGNNDVRVQLNNISAMGTYPIGPVPGRKQVTASCVFNGVAYTNYTNRVYGSVTIDSLTTTRIHGLFHFTCFNGVDSVEVTNGSFGGKYY